MEHLAQLSESGGVGGTESPGVEPADTGTATGFRCYICGEPSTEICSRCTRDTCDNHICERCLLCSDCCTCDDRPR